MILRRLLSYLPWLTAFSAALTLLLVALPRGVQADTMADVRKMIQASEDKEDAAAAKKDVEGAFSACVSYFMIADGKGGIAELPALKKQMQTVFQTVQALSSKSSVQKITLKGSKATVRVTNHMVMSFAPASGQPAAKPSQAAIDSVNEEHWIKTENVWRRETATVISQTMSRDGKPFHAEQPKPQPKQK